MKKLVITSIAALAAMMVAGAQEGTLSAAQADKTKAGAAVEAAKPEAANAAATADNAAANGAVAAQPAAESKAANAAAQPAATPAVEAQKAQQPKRIVVTEVPVRGFYFGVDAGTSYGCATFRSITSYQFLAGPGAGVQAGYRFNRIFSLQAFAQFGQVNMIAEQCCAAPWVKINDPIAWSNYLTRDNHHKYFSSNIADDGWKYQDLKTKTFARKYGVQANVNLLGLFRNTRYSRWTVELSPRVAYVVTTTTHWGNAYKINGVEVYSQNKNLSMKRPATKHFSYGGELSATYRIGNKVDLGLYISYDELTGDHFDSIPYNANNPTDITDVNYIPNPHYENFLYDAGVKLTFSFGKSAPVKKYRCDRQ